MSDVCGGCGTSIEPPKFCSQCGAPITYSEGAAHPVRARTLESAKKISHRGSTKDPAAPEYVSLQHAALTLSVSVKTVRQWIAAGELRAYRRGKRIIRVKSADLESLMRPIPSARHWTD